MKKLYEKNDIQNIANAIREKNSSETLYKVSEMSDAILNIPTGGGSPNIISGSFTPTDDDNVPGGGIVVDMPTTKEIICITVYKKLLTSELDKYGTSGYCVIFREDDRSKGSMFLTYKGSGGYSYTASQGTNLATFKDATKKDQYGGTSNVISIFTENGVQKVKFKTYGSYTFRPNFEHIYIIQFED